MSPKRGDFALVYFPHSDLTTIKLRPVLVVQADDLDTGLPQLIVAMVSSNLARAGHATRLTIRLSDPLAPRTGLKTDSVILADNLATIERRLIKRVIGRMPDMESVNRLLRITLSL
jgi:mRNA interferase MazF